MRRWRLAACGLAALAAIATTPALPAHADSVADAKARAAALRKRIAELGTQTAQAIADYEAVANELTQVISNHISAVDAADQARRNAVEGEERANDRIRVLYMTGGEMALYASVLDAGNPNDLFSRVANVRAVVSADKPVNDQLKAEARAAENHAAQLRQLANRRLQLESDARKRAERVAVLLDQQQALLTQADARVRELIEAERRRAMAITRTLATAIGGPAYQGQPGMRYACPVGPVNSFVDTWGAPRSGGRRHQGTDIFAPYGSPAYAVVDGVIDKWGNGGLGGISLWLQADNGDRYYYAHNSMNVARVGTRVRAGDLIARVGDTGNAATTPPHIHFEAHAKGGPAANPYPFLAAICK